jgi:hypothetical protein
MELANTLAYFDTPIITAVKCLVTWFPGWSEQCQKCQMFRVSEETLIKTSAVDFYASTVIIKTGANSAKILRTNAVLDIT